MYYIFVIGKISYDSMLLHCFFINLIAKIAGQHYGRDAMSKQNRVCCFYAEILAPCKVKINGVIVGKKVTLISEPHSVVMQKCVIILIDNTQSFHLHLNEAVLVGSHLFAVCDDEETKLCIDIFTREGYIFR